LYSENIDKIRRNAVKLKRLLDGKFSQAIIA